MSQVERTERIQYRATPSEVRGLERLAKARGLTMADTLRQLVREATQTQRRDENGSEEKRVKGQRG